LLISENKNEWNTRIDWRSRSTDWGK
jgi:hypothetical protein